MYTKVTTKNQTFATADVRPIWNRVHQRKKFENGEKFNGILMDVPALFTFYKSTFNKAGLGTYLGPTEDNPLLPEVPIPHANDSLEERTYAMRMAERRDKILEKYQKALGLLMAPWGEDPLSEFPDDTMEGENWRTKYNRIMGAFREKYRPVKLDIVFMELDNSLRNCPKATNLKEAQRLLTLITTCDTDRKFFSPNRGLCEDDKRAMCMQKLDTSVFRELIIDMQGRKNEDPYTFAEIKAGLKRMADTARVIDAGDTPLAEGDEVVPTTDILPEPGSTSSSLVNATGAMRCKNCQSTHHLIRQCDSFCKLCTDPSSPHRHHPMDCPEFLARQKQGTKASSDKKKKARTDSNTENLYDKVAKKNKVNMVKATTSESQSSSWYDEDQSMDEIFVPNGGFDVNMIVKKAGLVVDEDFHPTEEVTIIPHSAEALELTIGMLDTGANVSITHPHLAKILGVEVHEWEKPMPIAFGNATGCVSTSFIDLGDILGKVALVDSAPSTIISKHALHDRGLSIALHPNGICQLVFAKDNAIMFETKLESTKDFFMIPLEELLPQDLVQNIHQYQATFKAQVYGRRKSPSVTKEEIEQVMELHQRMYHPSCTVMARAIRAGAWAGVTVSAALVERVFEHQDCLHCSMGKMKRLPRNSGSAVKPLFGQIVSIDYIPVNAVAIGGHTGCYVIVEQSQGYAWAMLTSQNNNQAQAYKAIVHVRSCLLQHKFKLETVRTDAGRVENSQLLAVKVAEFGIVITSAAPEAQYQNFVERFIQTAIRGIATNLASQRLLDNSFWSMALLAWIRAWNCRPNTSSGEYSPHFALTGTHPNIETQFKFPFGTAVVSRKLQGATAGKHSKAERFKFAAAGELGFVVGNTAARNGASLVYFPKKGSKIAFPRVDIMKVHMGETAATDEEIRRHLQETELTDSGLKLPTRVDPTVQTQEQEQDIPEQVEPGAIRMDLLEYSSEPSGNGDQEIVDELTPQDETVVMDVVPLEVVDVQDATDDVVSNEQSGGTEQYQGPTTRARAKRARENDEEVSDPAQVQKVKKLSADTPTLTQAMRSDEADQWQEAIELELDSLISHGTGTRVSRSEIPPRAQILPIKVVLRIKRDALGLPIKYKARLCVLGNLYRKDPHISVFSPTANDKSLKFVLAMATAMRLPLRAIDVFGAFLYPTQDEEVFVAFPKAITAGEEIFWKLNKTMYGLPTSPKAFYEHVSQHLLTAGYSRCTSDPCFFWKRQGKDFLWTVVHVDDFIYTSTSEELENDFIRDLEEQYVVSRTKIVQHFLGIFIEESQQGRRRLVQPGLLKKMMEAYQLPPMSKTPTVPMSSLFNEDKQNQGPRCDVKKYQEVLGSLMYLVKTRPDIAFAVNRLSMRTTMATENDLMALYRILAYAWDTRDKGINLGPVERDSPITIEGFCDSSYASLPDAKSQSGYGFRIVGSQGGLFYCRSVKQTVVALSSTEAELMAAVEITKDAIWMRDLLNEIGFEQPKATVIWVDSASLIHLAENFSGNHKRVKHFIVKLNFLIEQVNANVVTFQKVHTKENMVDALTKPLGPIDFLAKRSGLLG